MGSINDTFACANTHIFTLRKYFIQMGKYILFSQNTIVAFHENNGLSCV